jgi:diacylglycerol kinase (ATP)
VALLYNRHSGRNARGDAAPLPARAQQEHLPCREVRTPEEVAAALADFGRAGADVIAISGGDGTVQAALSALLRNRTQWPLPLIATLPGGTANMTAADIGMRGSPTRAFARLLAWARGETTDAEIVRRNVLRLQITPGQQPLFGMFFGAGAIYQGIQYTHRRIYRFGLRSDCGRGLALGRFVLAMLRGNRDLATPGPIGVALDNESMVTRESALVLVTTLERLMLGLRPYWGDGSGVLRYTQVYAHPQHLLRAFPSIVRARANRFVTPANGYVSRNADTIRLTLAGGFTLDGELYGPLGTTAPVVLSDGGQVDFVRV